MGVTNWLVIVPLSVASPVTGLVSSLGTDWGIFRHYWVLVKLLITIPATLILLLLHTKPIDYLARVATATSMSGRDLGQMRVQVAVEAGAACVVLVVATALLIYKPRGKTGREFKMPKYGAFEIVDSMRQYRV
jgi:hypothetical protein